MIFGGDTWGIYIVHVYNMGEYIIWGILGERIEEGMQARLVCLYIKGFFCNMCTYRRLCIPYMYYMRGKHGGYVYDIYKIWGICIGEVYDIYKIWGIYIGEESGVYICRKYI